jgi:predicted RNA methylase
MAQIASDNVKRLNLQDRVEIIEGDLFKYDLSGADIVYLYLSEVSNKLIKPKLEKELKSTARVVSHYHKIRGWRISDSVKVIASLGDRKFPLTERPIYLYRMNEIY